MKINKITKKILLKDGLIIDPFKEKKFKGSILIENGFISKISNERLLSSANALYEILDNHKIPYIKAWSAIFVFVDLSRFLDENTYDGEKKLQSKLFNE